MRKKLLSITLIGAFIVLSYLNKSYAASNYQFNAIKERSEIYRKKMVKDVTSGLDGISDNIRQNIINDINEKTKLNIKNLKTGNAYLFNTIIANSNIVRKREGDRIFYETMFNGEKAVQFNCSLDEYMEIKKEEKWSVTFDISGELEQTENSSSLYDYVLYVTQVKFKPYPKTYNGNGENTTEENTTEETGNGEDIPGTGLASLSDLRDNFNSLKSTYESLKETVDKMGKFVRNMAENPAGTLINLFLDVFTVLFGDLPQGLANMVQTTIDHTALDFKIMYSYEYLKEDGESSPSNEDKGAGNRDKYTKVGEYGTKGSNKNKENGKITINQQTIEVSGRSEGDSGDVKKDNNDKDNDYDPTDRHFTKETLIPVIPVDIYSMAAGTVELLDANIIQVNKNIHKDEKDVWYRFRTFSATVIRLGLYICTVFILTLIIWHGIALVKGSISPNNRVKHKEGIIHFAKAIFMLAGIVFIMAICISMSKAVLGETTSNTSVEGPLRIHVKDAKGKGLYSFSTNVTGYARYMAQNDNVHLSGEKATFVGAYIVCAISNLILTICMALRMLGLTYLGILGPIIVGFYAAGKEESAPVKYSQWIKLYATLAAFQLFLAIGYKIVLDLAI